MKNLDRRQLLKLASLAGAGALLPRNASASALGALLEKLVEGLGPGTIGKGIEKPEPDPRVNFGMVIDLGRCIGCRRCSYACKRENNIPDTINPPYIMVFETLYKPGQIIDPDKIHLHHSGLTYDRLYKDRMYLPVQCNHCKIPPCTKVCPTKATYKDKDGIVMVDYNKCIGCRYCMSACPYNARRFNWWDPEVPADRVNPLVPIRQHGVVEKCTFCVHRTRRGKTTACVNACPNRVRTFGNLNDPDNPVSELIKSERNFRLKEGLNTGPQIWYLTRSKRKTMWWFRALPIDPNIRGLKS